MNSFKNIILFILFIFLIVSCNTNKEQNKYSEIISLKNNYTDGYIGDKQCATCHKAEYKLWKGSHHDLAMQVANDSTVLGNFNNIKIKLDGVSYLFFKKDTNFIVKIKEINGIEKNYKIAYTFGFTPLQQYLIDFDNGKKQVLRVTWNTIKNEWYHQYKGDIIKQHDWLHWTRGAQNWNTMCAECHSTNLKKNYSSNTDSYQTTYSSINVSCESCHGPAENHLRWANSDRKNKNKNILISKTQEGQLNMCASCHSRRSNLTDAYTPGEKFVDQHLIQNLNTNFYHKDGQIKDEVYVYGSFLQSKMYAEGVTCNDCHNAHSLKLKFKGNKLCLQCHIPDNYETERHYFHKNNTDASQCINCHMAGKNYMGNDFRRDHSFRIPRPDQSIIYNTPNACTQCHKDKTNKWAAAIIKEKFGAKRKSHFSDDLLLSSKNNLTKAERNQIYNFINNLQYPPIARATVIENLNVYNEKSLNTLMAALKDSSALVRYRSLQKLKSLPKAQKKSVALNYIKDSIKLVRIGAAQMLIGIDENTLNQIDKDALTIAKYEFETMLFSNVDFSVGSLQLGDYYLQTNDLTNAIKYYEKALKKDNLLTIVYSNLATAYSLNEDYENALKTLNKWEEIEPKLDQIHYIKALLFFERKQDEKAVLELDRAIQLNPNNTRAMYNLSIYYYQDKKNLKKAKEYINSALKIEPRNQDYSNLFRLISKVFKE